MGGGRSRLGRLRHARLWRPRPPVLQARRLRHLRAPGTVKRVLLVAAGWPAEGQEPKGKSQRARGQRALFGCSGRSLARLRPAWVLLAPWVTSPRRAYCPVAYLPSPRLLPRGLPPLAALTAPWVTSARRAYCPVGYLPSPRLLSRGLPPLAALGGGSSAPGGGSSGPECQGSCRAAVGQPRGSAAPPARRGRGR